MCYDDDDDFNIEPITESIHTPASSWNPWDEPKTRKQQREEGYNPIHIRDVYSPDDPPPSDHTVKL